MDGSTSSTVVTALTDGFGDMATEALNGIGAILPVVLPILAAIIVVGIVIRVVKRITGR